MFEILGRQVNGPIFFPLKSTCDVSESTYTISLTYKMTKSKSVNQYSTDNTKSPIYEDLYI